MKKCLVLEKCIIVVEKDSEVLVSDRQFEQARMFLKPIGEDKVKKTKKKESK